MNIAVVDDEEAIREQISGFIRWYGRHRGGEDTPAWMRWSSFQGYCLQYFFWSFLEGRLRNRRINGLIATVLYGVLRLGVGIFLPKGYGSLGTFVKLAAIMCIISVIALIFYRAIGKITLFLVVTFMAAGEISFFLAHMFFESGNHPFSLWNWCLEKGFMPSLECYEIVVNITLIGNQILLYVIGAALLYFTMRKIVKDYREKEYAIHRPELLFILTPGLAGLMVCTLLLFSIVSGIKLFQDMICWNREKSSRIILEKQVSSLQEHMGEMERVYSGIRGM